jgi:hypothetical protein
MRYGILRGRPKYRPSQGSHCALIGRFALGATGTFSGYYVPALQIICHMNQEVFLLHKYNPLSQYFVNPGLLIRKYKVSKA